MQKHHPGQFLQRNLEHLLELPDDMTGVGNILWYEACPGLVSPKLVLLRRAGAHDLFLCHLRDLIGRELDTTLWAWCR